MSNYLEYLKWRGDLSFDVSPFNEIDAIILSQIVYLEMDGLVTDDMNYTTVTIRNICEYMLKDFKPSNYIEKMLYETAQTVAMTKRFQDIPICGYVDEIDNEAYKQFCAATFRIGPKLHFVAFRGTDNTLVGWKENLDLSYSAEVPSQKEAVEYLKRAAEGLKGKLIVGGHSKGGNLAVYSTAFVPKKVSSRIMDVYNFDGPGFNELVMSRDRFYAVADKIHTYVPQNSLIGLLLRHHEPFMVIKSSKRSGAAEHQMISWEVGPRYIEHLDDLGVSGKYINENITEWIDSLTYEQKKQFIEVVYDLVDEYTTVEDLAKPKNIRAIMKAYSALSVENRRSVQETMGALGDTVKENIKEHVSNGSDRVIGSLKKKVSDKYNEAQKIIRERI